MCSPKRYQFRNFITATFSLSGLVYIYLNHVHSLHVLTNSSVPSIGHESVSSQAKTAKLMCMVAIAVKIDAVTIMSTLD